MSNAPTKPASTPLSHSYQIQTRPQTHSTSGVQIPPTNRRYLSNIQRTDEREYTVHRIVRHIRPEPFLKYVVRRYWYTFEEDTIDPSKHILQHFKMGYWQHSQRRQGGKLKKRSNSTMLPVLDRLYTTAVLGIVQSRITHSTQRCTADPNASSAKYDSNVHNDDKTRNFPSLIPAFCLPACVKKNTIKFK